MLGGCCDMKFTMSKTDLLSWDDDLDLDILLGEYTDTDPIVDSDDDFVLVTGVHPPPKKKGQGN